MPGVLRVASSRRAYAARGQRIEIVAIGGGQRIALGMRLGTVGVDEGDALRDQPAGARGTRRRNKMCRALDAEPGIATQRLAAALGIEHLRQIGQLMDDDVGTCPHGGVA